MKSFIQIIAVVVSCSVCFMVGKKIGADRLSVVEKNTIADAGPSLNPKPVTEQIAKQDVTAPTQRQGYYSLPAASLEKLNLRLFRPDMKLTSEFTDAASLTNEQASKMNELIGNALSDIAKLRDSSAVVTDNAQNIGSVEVVLENAAIQSELNALKNRIEVEVSPSAAQLFAIQLNHQLQRNDSALFRAAKYEVSKDGQTPSGVIFLVKMNATPINASSPTVVVSMRLTREQLLLRVPLAGNLYVVNN